MNSSLTYRYVRNKLLPAEVEEYEQRMLDSPELQDELEEVLLLQQALQFGKTESVKLQDSATWKTGGRPARIQWALAASVTILLASAYLLVSSWSEKSVLINQVASLSKPRPDVLVATVKIMRTAGNSVPDSIIQLPDKKTTVMLEIELGSRSRGARSLLFSFESENAPGNLSWVGSPDKGGLTTVAINSEQIPLGLVWLIVSATDGAVLERRLLEFKASGQD